MPPALWLDHEAVSAQQNTPLFYDAIGFLIRAGLPQHAHQLLGRCHEFHYKPAAAVVRALSISEPHRAALLATLDAALAFLAGERRPEAPAASASRGESEDKDEGEGPKSKGWSLNAEFDEFIATTEKKEIARVIALNGPSKCAEVIGDLTVESTAREEKAQEDKLRMLFVSAPEHPSVADPYALLTDIWQDGS